MKQTTTEPLPTNLVQAITDILAKIGHPRPTDWTRGLHPDATITSDIGIQRFLINRCFRMILGEVTTESTMDTRYCLVESGDIGDWLRLFETGIAPTVVRLCLPIEQN